MPSPHLIHRLALALSLSATLGACADEDTVVVREPRAHVHAAPGGPGTMIHSAMNGALCFDAAGDRAASHTPVRLSSCRGQENQLWSFGPPVRGAESITGIGGLCLDVHRSGTPVASMQLFRCHGSDNQAFVYLADGRMQEAATGGCLTAAGMGEGAPIVVQRCDPRVQEQVWTVADR